MSIRDTQESAQRMANAEARQHDLGQFFTPNSIADFMASLLSDGLREVHLLDAGAGVGALSAAVVRRICAQLKKPRCLTVTAYECDSHVLPKLRDTLAGCARQCEAAGIQFTTTIHEQDFIEATAPAVSGDLFAQRVNLCVSETICGKGGT